jgi:hypothetical protein
MLLFGITLKSAPLGIRGQATASLPSRRRDHAEAPCCSLSTECWISLLPRTSPPAGSCPFCRWQPHLHRSLPPEDGLAGTLGGHGLPDDDRSPPRRKHRHPHHRPPARTDGTPVDRMGASERCAAVGIRGLRQRFGWDALAQRRHPTETSSPEGFSADTKIP